METIRRGCDTLAGVRSAIENDCQIAGQAEAPILIYQAGKVASTSVAFTIKHLLPQAEVIHVHGLTAEFWRRMHSYGDGNRDGRPFLDACRIMEHEALQLSLRVDASRCVPLAERGWKWRVITITREPIAQTLSGLFHLSEYVIASLADKHGNHSKALNRIDAALRGQIEQYRSGSTEEPKDFIEQACRNSFDHIDQWFDYEVKDVFGSDLYARPYDFNRGYARFQTDLADVLVLRFEDMFQHLDEALGEFLGFPSAEVKASQQTRNKTDAKPAGEAFAEYLRTLVLPREFLDTRYDSKYSRHFYTPEELEKFKTRWSTVNEKK
ncbi:MAG: putative capsular polysaccharide synthesis family protein [Limisphaerales bacterium]